MGVRACQLLDIAFRGTIGRRGYGVTTTGNTQGHTKVVALTINLLLSPPSGRSTQAPVHAGFPAHPAPTLNPSSPPRAPATTCNLHPSPPPIPRYLYTDVLDFRGDVVLDVLLLGRKYMVGR